MLTPRRRKEKPIQKRQRKPRIVEPRLNFEQTEKGSVVIRINTDAYISFGKEEVVKWVSVHYDDGHSYVTKMFPVNMQKLPARITKQIGKKNIARVRELVRERLSTDGLLPRKKLMKMGAIINKENAE